MTLQNHFSPRRFLLLFKRDLIQGYKVLLITSAAVIGTLLLILLLSSAGKTGEDFHEGLFLPLLWLGGLIFTSLCFKESHSVNQIHQWLMTPASPLEKFMEKLLLSTVFYVLALLAGFFLATCLNSLIYLMIFKQTVPLFNPAQSWLWFNIGHYMIIQSIFFLGAVWFRKYNFVKTVLSLNVVQILLAMAVGGIAALAYWGPIKEAAGGNAHFFVQGGQIIFQNFHRLNPFLLTVLKFIYFGLIAPFFWFLSWLRMREIEVKDGV